MSEEKRSPIEEALATLQANPQIITRIADAIGMEAPSVETPADSTETVSADPTDGLLDKIPLIMSALGQSGLGKLNLGALMGDPQKTALLRALCPYLSPTRRETAETILQLWAVGEALRGR